MAIINGTFDIDLSGWTATGNVSWDNGMAHLGGGCYGITCNIYQTFEVTDNLLQFDWQTIGYAPTDSGSGYELYIDGVLKSGERLPGNYNNLLSGTKTIYLGSYIGRTAKILFYEVYNWQAWIDNVTLGHTTGVFNGTFDQGLVGWDLSGDTTKVGITTCSYEGFGPPCSGNMAVINSAGILSQTFIIDKCELEFNWYTNGPDNGYEISVGGVIVKFGIWNASSSGTEVVDLSSYAGDVAIIKFYSNNYRLYIDNVSLSVKPYDVSVMSYPPGGEIYLDVNDTGMITGDTPIVIDGGSDGPHIITLKLAGYPDYTENINIISCQTTYVNAVFAGCISFITTPVGAKICIDNVDTGFITPKTFCGYSTGGSHTYSLYLKDHGVETDIITFPEGKGILIDKTLIYDTGSINFNVAPNGSKIIIDGIDTEKVTPDIVDNIPVGYHSYEIRKDGYNPLIGSFRSIAGKEKLIIETLQQIIGIANGTFDTNLDGWTFTSPDPRGYVEWVDGRAHLVTDDVPISFSKDFIANEDTLVFYYDPPVSLNHSCGIGWSVIADPDTLDEAVIATYCGWGQKGYSLYEYWGYFEVDVSTYIGKTIRVSFNLNYKKTTYIGGPAEAYLDDVGNIPKLARSITFDAFCPSLPDCPTATPQVPKCYADLYFDGNYIGVDQLTLDNISLGQHSWQVIKNRYYDSETLSKYITGNVALTQGVSTHIYIDNTYLPARPMAQFSYSYPRRTVSAATITPYIVAYTTMFGTYYQGKIRFVWSVDVAYAWQGVYTQIFKNDQPLGELHLSIEIDNYEETVDVNLDPGDTISLKAWSVYWCCDAFVLDNMTMESIISVVECIIKRDEGIYSKPKYCYIGEGIFAK